MLDAFIHTFVVNIRDIRYLVSNTPSPPVAPSVPRRSTGDMKSRRIPNLS